jgi:hypothetical protein
VQPSVGKIAEQTLSTLRGPVNHLHRPTIRPTAVTC